MHTPGYTVENKLHLSLVENDDELSPLDIKNLDVDKLRQHMVQSIYVLEAALASQAKHEYQRITDLRGFITGIEQDLLSASTMADLKPEDKIKLYGTLSQNMRGSLGFLQDFHSNIASALDAVSQLDKMKTTVKAPEDAKNSQLVEQLKSILRQKLKEKVTT